jgi:Flp pilus assembly protein TadD
MSRAAALALLAAGAAGCKATTLLPMTNVEIVRAIHTRGLEPASVLVPFDLTPEMRAWVHEAVPDSTPASERLDRLLAELLGGRHMRLEYAAGYTGTAAEVFATHRANCLAFTSLFVGLSREIGMQVYFLDVDDIEKFEKEGDLVVISEHVSAGFGDGPDRRVLDFSANGVARYRRIRRISDLTAIALYHSNRGAETLRAGKTAQALQWMSQAVQLDPALTSAWVNFGVAQRRTGDSTAAEAAYRKALALDPTSVSAYENLASLLRLQGRNAEADKLIAATARISTRNPFTFISLGDYALSHGRIEEARTFYRRAERLSNQRAEPYAALGELSLAAGNREEAERFLRKAAQIDAAEPRVKRLAAHLGEPPAGS